MWSLTARVHRTRRIISSVVISRRATVFPPFRAMVLVIACQEHVGLEEPVNELDESQDVIIQGLQLAPKGSCLLLACSALGIEGSGLDCRWPTAIGLSDFPA